MIAEIETQALVLAVRSLRNFPMNGAAIGAND